MGSDLASRAVQIPGVGAWEWDLQAGTLHVSPGLRATFGLADPSPIGARDDLIHCDDRARGRAAFAAALDTGTVQLEVRMRRAAGDYRRVLLAGEVIRDDAGRPTQMMGIQVDVTELETERSRSEAALAQREIEFRTLVDNSPDMVLRWDRELRRTYVNQTYAEAVGLPREQVIGTTLGSQYTRNVSSVNAEYLRELAVLVTRAFETGETITAEFPWVGIFGKRIIENRLVPERGADGTVVSVLGIGRDITEMKEAEREARTLAEHSPDVIARFDAHGRYLYVNHTTQVLTKRTLAGYVGHHIGELIGRDANGQPIEGFVQLRDLVSATCATKVATSAELNLPIGALDRWFDIRLIPELDEVGELASVLLVARDTTERRALEAQLRQSQKLEAVGQLAGGIAHDFNNMLAVVLMQAGLALSPETTLEQMQEHLHAILDATERAANLTRQLLTFSGRKVARRAEIDLRKVVVAIVKLLARLLGEHITVETDLSAPIPCILADPGMIEQVVMNLAINARDAMPRGGVLTIAVADVVTTTPGASASAHADHYACLSVRDTGAGIDPDHLPRIFEPFFTTKEPGKGTGLGLATVFGIVQQHHGWIEVDSQPGAGTTFKVYLPVLDSIAQSPSDPPSDSAQPVRGANETILLVEDDDALRHATRRTLEQYGYRVVEADSASSALAMWRANRPAIELVLSDLVTRGELSGFQLAEQLAAEAPDLPVVLMSGYGSEVIQRLSTLDRGRAILSKPFSPASLTTAIRAELRRR